MKILVTGSYGQLGRALERELADDSEIEAIFTDYGTLDITDAEAVRHFLEEHPVDVIVNCAAYTAVDKAESDVEKARQVNTMAPGVLGKAAQRSGAKVIHVSTDYVFGGDNCRPYCEYDEPAPNSVYGRTKLAGESMLKAACHGAVIIRTAWLYSEDGGNFVKTMLRLADERDEICVVSDQIGTPTYAGDLAAAIHRHTPGPAMDSRYVPLHRRGGGIMVRLRQGHHGDGRKGCQGGSRGYQGLPHCCQPPCLLRIIKEQNQENLRHSHPLLAGLAAQVHCRTGEMT